MAVTVKLQGFERLITKAGALVPEARANVARAVAAGALRVEGDAKRLAPVDTGRLRASIVADADGLEASVGTNVVYAPYQEFGTSRMSAQPFLFPAIEANRVRIVESIRDALREALDG